MLEYFYDHRIHFSNNFRPTLCDVKTPSRGPFYVNMPHRLNQLRPSFRIILIRFLKIGAIDSYSPIYRLSNSICHLFSYFISKVTNLVLQKASKDCGFGDLLTSVCSKCRVPRGTSNVEFLAHLKFPGFLKNLPFFWRRLLRVCWILSQPILSRLSLLLFAYGLYAQTPSDT